MELSEAIKLAIAALELDARKYAFEAAQYDQGQVNFIYGKRASEKHSKRLEAIEVLKGLENKSLNREGTKSAKKNQCFEELSAEDLARFEL